MTLRLNGSTSGYVEIDAPATAGSNTLVLPTGNGTNGQYLQTNGSGALSWATVSTSNLTRGTEVATTSGTEVIYDSLPAGILRFQIAIRNVSCSSGTSQIKFQLRTGAGVNTTSGYLSYSAYVGGSNTNGISSATDSFITWLTVSGERNTGVVTFVNVASNKWIYSVAGGFYSDYTHLGGGYVDLADALTGIRIYNGSAATFNGGSVNILYEV